VPYSLELNDTIVYVVNKIEPRRYGQMIKDSLRPPVRRGRESGTVMCVPLHAQLPGQLPAPHEGL
jgi:hypothetical protein